MSKYYTPSIEEFHVGFEYETCTISAAIDIFDLKNNTVDKGDSTPVQWKRVEFENFADIKMIGSGKVDPKRTRVKYLDQEDIESLGFKMVFTSENTYTSVFGNTYLYGGFTQTGQAESLEIHVEETLTKKIIVIIEYVDETDESTERTQLFKGEVKNKSELKRILKQVGYEFSEKNIKQL